MRVVDSSAKVENVVNPPQIPVFKKSTSFGFGMDPFEASMATRAIAIQPAILIKNVFTGNRVVSQTGINPIR